MENDQGGTWLPLQDAAQQLGIPLDTLRKKAQRGTIIARKVTRPQGHSWEVYLDNSQVSSQVPREPASSDLAGPMERLIEENRRLAEQNVQLAGRVGWLEAQLQAEREKVAQLAAPPTVVGDPAGASVPGHRAPWWRFWARRPAEASA